ncbi:D-alanyl-D-alanine carboxypeptidase [Paraconexibacter antarcticus]|uniref:D-alanyl-D-alanine carboxypeptidase n=1 Tax=Paraconexibacter antarcticus TaxID=2949664 RepID=A0ABY5DUR2_9ACTN|nr:D-alanyl-D-alanine carboxypeptidase family protein [Paraconexibacter antarcticus]UTI64771.1 D-alanyl-D-alanine carboxypeptidase [Paraconexibacter antarcticus]
MSTRPHHVRRRIVALALALLACAAGVVAAGALVGRHDGKGGAVAAAGPLVSTVDGHGLPPIPPQGVNGPVLPTGPLPTSLAVNLAAPDRIRMPFHVMPRAGLVFDLDTGEVLWRRNPTRVLPMASVTKMMTALLVDERLPPGSLVRVTKQAVRTGGSKVGVLPLGKRVGVQAMLYGLLLPSGNDAAIALAQRVSGTTKAFVALMNARAAAMHLSCTRFASPSGLVDAGNHTCAYDLAALAKAFLDRPRLAGIVVRKQAILPFPIKGGKLYLYSHEPLVKVGYPGALGIKTGFTDAAGHCVVGAAERGGHRLGVVLLHSPDITAQSVKLLDRAFAYERRRDRR